jgi:hypothetical protein
MRTGMRGRLLAMTAVLLIGAEAVHATQHLVSAGENWQSIGPRLRPGDEIILMPGVHKPVTLTGARGEPDRPIIIRGLDPNNPPTIEAGRFGINLPDAMHVKIKDIVITGASVNGLAINTGIGGSPSEEIEPAPTSHITLENITINETGPAGSLPTRHAMHIRHASNVEIVGCRFRGWNGSAIEIIGGREVRIRDCTFEGTDDRTQESGVRIRGNSDRVKVEACRFENAGDQGVCIGGASDPEEFSPPLADDAEVGSLTEASWVIVRRCVFRGGLCAIAFVNADRSTVRNCTILRPKRAVVSIRHDQEDTRFRGSSRCAFGNNLITWEPGDLTELLHLGAGAELDSVSLEQNLWWSTDLSATLASLGAFPETMALPQVMNVNPLLDESLRPTAEAAAQFGAN